jgi:hypothetical protein
MFLTWAVYKTRYFYDFKWCIGLVGVTAGCAAVSQEQFFIGLICGVAVFSIELIKN